MELNWLIIAAAALVPTVVGFVWYNPKVLGTAWMAASGVTEEKMQGANMGVIFGVSLVLSFFLSLAVTTLVIHQTHMASILINETGFGEAGSPVQQFFDDFLSKYGTNFRTFKHGAFHGVLAGILFALPILGTNALFERKGFKYIAINAGYWIVTLALMGGIICAWA